MLLVDRIENMTPKEQANIELMWPELFDHTFVRRHMYGKENDVVEIDRYRDYNPDIIFWIDATNIDMIWNDQKLNPLPNNIPHDGTMYWIQGKFWEDEWGNACFKPKIHKEARHYLVKVEWGGPHNNTRGVEWDAVAPDARHYKRCVSHNGKQGINYYILPMKYNFMGEVLTTTEEDKING